MKKKKKHDPQLIRERDQLILIPNGVVVCEEDIKNIYGV